MEERRQARPRRRASLARRLIRLKLRWLGITLILLAGILLDGTLPRFVAGWALGGIIGADVTIDRLRFVDTELVAEGVNFRAPLWQGPGARVASIDRVRIDLDWKRTLLWDPHLTRMELEGGTVYVLESPDDSSAFNIAALRTVTRTPRTPGERKPTDGELPFDELVARDLTYVTGLASDEPLPAWNSVGGTLSVLRAGASAPLWNVLFALPTLGITAEGTYDAAAVQLEALLHSMSWRDDMMRLLPSRARVALEAIEPRGTITGATFVVGERRKATLTAEVSSFTANFPREAVAEGWLRVCGGMLSGPADPPTLHIDHARAAISSERLELVEAEGSLVYASATTTLAPLPFSGEGWIDVSGVNLATATSGDGTFARALDNAAFSGTLRVHDFRLATRGASSCMALPASAARALQQLQVRSIELDLEARVDRAARTMGSGPQPILSEVSLALRSGSITVPAFPYPLDAVTGAIRLREGTVHLDRLRGVGPGGGVIEVSGTLTGLEGPPAIDVVLSCPDIQVNEALKAAIARQIGPVLDEIFDMSAAKALAPRIASLGLSPFVPGGRASFEIRVHRAEQREEQVELTGAIRIIEGRVLLKQFPLPLLATSGVIGFQPGRVSFTEPIQFRSLHGGRGSVSGHLDLVEVPTGRGIIAVPQLHFEAYEEPMNPLLWSAIPPESREREPSWPGALTLAGDILDSLQPRGSVRVSGEVTRFGASPAFDIVVEASAASIGPPSDARAVDALGWPSALLVTDATGRVRITPGRVTVERSSGALCGGAVTAAGLIIGDDRRIDVSLDDAALDCLLTSAGAVDPSAPPDWWTRLAPTGTVDATLTATAANTSVTLRPATVEATLGGERLRAIVRHGHIDVHHQPSLVDVGVTIAPLSGAGDAFPNAPLQAVLNLTWDQAIPPHAHWSVAVHDPAPGARAAAALLREVGAADLADIASGLGLSAEGVLTIEGERASLSRADASLASATLGSDTASPLRVKFESPAVITLREGVLATRDLTGPIAGGSVSICATGGGLAGGGASGNPPWGRVEIDAAGDGTPELLSVIPDPLRSALRALDFHPGTHASLRGGVVTWSEAGTRGVFPIALVDASMDVGIDVVEYSGALGVTLVDTAWSVECMPERACLRSVPTGVPHATISGMPDQPIKAIVSVPTGDGTLVADVSVEPQGPWSVRLDGTRVPLADLALAGGVHTTTPLAGLVHGQAIVTGGDAPVSADGAFVVTDGDFGAPPPDMFNPLGLGGDRRLRRLESRFHLEDGVAHLTELSLSTDGVKLIGDALVTLDSGRIDGRLRGRSDIPIVSDLLGAIVDPLVQIEVNGTLAAPESRAAPLPGILSAPRRGTSPPTARPTTTPTP